MYNILKLIESGTAWSQQILDINEIMEKIRLICKDERFEIFIKHWVKDKP
jgi:hypothetical protein